MTPETPSVARERSELRDTGYEIFIALVALLSIFNLILLWIVQDAALESVLWFMNALCSMVLFGDFCLRLKTARSRTDYFFRRFGWADLLSCLPIPQVKILRVFRLARVWRLLREIGVRTVAHTLLRNTAGSALLTLLFIALLVLEFGSLEMLRIESAYPGANIVTASDSIWYMIVTMSTVGYGDQYPVSNLGRLLGSLVIIIGVGIFGTLTGFLANAFVKSREHVDDEQRSESLPPELTSSQRRVAELEQLRAVHREALARIDRLIDEESA